MIGRQGVCPVLSEAGKHRASDTGHETAEARMRMTE